MESKERMRLEVNGHVQGVGFRYSAMLMARNLNLSGWVKNRPDGSVCLEAQGDPESLSLMIKWCYQGPSRAVVESVNITSLPLADEDIFRIL
jgi:acylphosphatase